MIDEKILWKKICGKPKKIQQNKIKKKLQLMDGLEFTPWAEISIVSSRQTQSIK